MLLLPRLNLSIRKLKHLLKIELLLEKLIRFCRKELKIKEKDKNLLFVKRNKPLIKRLEEGKVKVLLKISVIFAGTAISSMKLILLHV
jgi:hypothetical protein